MKKRWFFALAGLIMVSLLVSGCGSLLGGANPSYLADQRTVADVADVAEVQDTIYEPRRNHLAQRADGAVYAIPATALKPEAERLPPPVYAISGVKDQEISETNPWEVVDVVVILPQNESFVRGIIEGYEVNDWIINLPPGLEARVHGVKAGATQVKIYISGTPKQTGRDYIKVSIPGTYLKNGGNRTFTSPTEEESLEAWVNNETQGVRQQAGVN